VKLNALVPHYLQTVAVFKLSIHTDSKCRLPESVLLPVTITTYTNFYIPFSIGMLGFVLVLVSLLAKKKQNLQHLQRVSHLCLSHFQVMNLNNHFFFKKNLIRQFSHWTFPKFRNISSPTISDINGEHPTPDVGRRLLPRFV
jgi:hypothetical protein